MARKRVTVEDAIRNALMDADKGAQCSMISLVFIKGMSQEEIHSKQLSGEPQTASTLAEFFVGRATGYAQDLPGIQTFKLLFFYGKNEPQGSFPFTVADGELTAGGDVPFSKHEPTSVGLQAQLMKHNEYLMGMMTDIVKTYAVASLQREAELRKENQEYLMSFRDMLLSMRNEGHQHRMAELTFQRETQERQMLGRALPGIVNGLTGREIVPQEQVNTEIMEMAATHLKPEQIKQLIAMGVIPEQFGALLLSQLVKIRERQLQEANALKHLPPENSNSEEAAS